MTDKTLELLLERKTFTPERTIGALAVGGKHECFTVEDVVRPTGEKVFGKTAIPVGRYEIALTYSNRFKRVMPLLMNVPGFEGVRIHTGNTEKDTEGCIIVGQLKAPDNAGVLSSKIAFGMLYPKIANACKIGKVFITIK